MAEIKRGRRPGPSTTRDAILAAARERFSEHGYDRVRMRDVAADAGVDVALVTYHFGSKDGLFGGRAGDARADGGADGRRARARARSTTSASASCAACSRSGTTSVTGGALVALVRSAMSHPPAAARLREFVQAELLARIAERLDVPDADRRAALFGSQLIGIMLYRHVLHVEPVASMSREELVERAAPALQRHLTGS